MLNDKNFQKLYDAAFSVINPRQLTEFLYCGQVGAALESDSGKIYTGVCIDAACSVGFCAEHAAAAAMITAGESRIIRVIAVGCKGNIMPPCGRCRELMLQLNDENKDTAVMVAENIQVPLASLLPYDWRIDAPPIGNR